MSTPSPHPQSSTLLSTGEKRVLYSQVATDIRNVLDGETNQVARMATISCLLDQAFDHFFWTGFYVADRESPDELVVGPYQGTLGCLRIAFGRGVCGIAAAERTTQIVEDVHAFPGHIACDTRTNSEIVVPVLDKSGHLFAVLDIDSELPAAFDEVDRVGLEAIVAEIFTT